MINTHKIPSPLQSPMMARMGALEADPLTMLGDQLILDPSLMEENPELANLMSQDAELQNFGELLAQSDANQALMNQNVSPELNSRLLDENLLDKSLAGVEKKQLNLVTQNGEVPFLSEDGEQNLNIFKNEKSLPAQLPANSNVKKETKNKIADNKGLMDLNTFMSKQNHTTKLNMAKAAYQNPNAQSMFAKQVESLSPKAASSTINPTNTEISVKAADLMLMNAQEGSSNEPQMSMGQNNQLKPSATQGSETAKVFDLSSLNTNQDVINQIQDYLIQAKASSSPTVQMSFKHNELGQVDLLVQKVQGEQLSIMINSHTSEGTKFFNQNRNDLMQSLSNSGVQVTELKLESGSSLNSGHDKNDQSSSRSFAEQNARSDQQQRQQDSKRREELWNIFREREAA